MSFESSIVLVQSKEKVQIKPWLLLGNMTIPLTDPFMKNSHKPPLNHLVPALILICLIALLGAGCASSKPAPNPLSGWKLLINGPDCTVSQAIIDDYQEYIRKLPPKDRTSVGIVQFLKDGTGQHAVNIEIERNHTIWEHVLIYDTNSKRTDTIKYYNGRYQS